MKRDYSEKGIVVIKLILQIKSILENDFYAFKYVLRTRNANKHEMRKVGLGLLKDLFITTIKSVIIQFIRVISVLKIKL